MNYNKVSEAMFDDLNDWLVSEPRRGLLVTLYSMLIQKFLSEKYGELNDKAHKEIVKNLLGKLIG
jgi:hypothetical protein